MGCERLEARALLSGSPGSAGEPNLRLLEIALSDSSGVPVSTPQEHLEYWLSARWETTALAADATYQIRFELADRVYEAATYTFGAGQESGTFQTVRGPFQMTAAGQYTARVTLDSTARISESDETDNSLEQSIEAQPVPPPSFRMQLPLGGTPNVDWSILNYVDLDSGPGAADFLGGNYTYNGHDAIDFMLPNFAAMDRGVPVYAAAAGRVERVLDGQWDRYTDCTFATENFVLIDHGDGWETNYAHFRLNSIVVASGQMVEAGDLLGYIGSSGCSSDAHLHFALWHYEVPVETYLQPENYWLPEAILPYAGDTPGVTDFGVTDGVVTSDLMKERPPDRYTFEPVGGQGPRFWARVHGLPAGTTLTVRWYQPNGNLYGSPQTTVLSSENRYGQHTAIRPLSPSAPQGTWQVALEIDGLEVARDTFQVTTVPTPEIKLYQGSTYVIDGRTTPLDLGIAAQGTANPMLTCTIFNHGTGDLTISQIEVPAGFRVVSPPPALIARGGSGTFTLALETSAAGKRTGWVRLATNDSSEADYRFAVTGNVLDLPPTVVGVWLGSSAWFDQGPGGGDRWWAIAVGSGEQLRPLPWTGLNQVRLAFSEPVAVTSGDLRVFGQAIAEYSLVAGGFSYDVERHEAVWTLAQPLAADRIALQLKSGLAQGVHDLTSQLLDGDWINPTSPAQLSGDWFPSGNGLQGGDFVFEFRALVGDYNGDGEVGAADYAGWAAQANLPSASPWADFDGSGSIGAGDYTIWAARFGTRLPETPSAGGAAPRAPLSLQVVANASPPRDTGPAHLSAVPPRGQTQSAEPHEATFLASLWTWLRERGRIRSA